MIKKLSNHLSLFVIIIGAGSFFLSNLILKDVFNAYIYGQYSIIISYFSLIYVVGIFGADQVFLRFSIARAPDVIETQRAQFYLVPGILLVSSIIGTFVFRYNYPEIEINLFLFFFSSMGMIGILFLFSILRLNSNFVFAQFVSNYWKIVLFANAFLFYFYKSQVFDVFIDIVLYNIILIFVLCLVYVYRKINFIFNLEYSLKDIVSTSFHFFLSILSAALILFSDRFIIELKFDFEKFGNFFYLTNFFLAPYTILQNYIGFKQLIIFKNNFSLEYYRKFNSRTIFFGLAMGIILLVAGMILSRFNIINFRFDDYVIIIVLLLITGTLRLFSSAINSAFEARTSMIMLRKSNLYILIFTCSILLFAIYVANSVEIILICMIFIWISRCMIHTRLLFPKNKI